MSERTGHVAPCFLCGLRRSASTTQMCRVCGPAFDRAMEKDDGSLLAMMWWTADRARRFAKKNAREKNGDPR